MFDLASPPALTGSPLDRRALWRDDPAALSTARGDVMARVMTLWQGKPLLALCETGVDLVWTPGPLDSDVFLGTEEGAPRYAREIGRAHPGEVPPPTPEGQKFIDLRSVSVSGDISDSEAAIAAQAKAMTGWHETHLHCAACGADTAIEQGGWRRRCGTCGAQHFPRTDPVVIMLVVHGERVALARNVKFPGNLYSLIAGFVEPGESMEAAVRRETHEELGLPIGRVGYVSSQPWPFPSSLMLGCIAEALDTRFTLEEAEIADARWLDRAELQTVFDGTHPVIGPPRRDAIAATLLRDWLDQRVVFGGPPLSE